MQQNANAVKRKRNKYKCNKVQMQQYAYAIKR